MNQWYVVTYSQLAHVLVLGICLFIPPHSTLAVTDAVTEQDLKFEFAFEIGGEPSYGAIQDRHGFLWFTFFFNGMVRFDGSEVKRFRAGLYFQRLCHPGTGGQ